MNTCHFRNGHLSGCNLLSWRLPRCSILRWGLQLLPRLICSQPPPCQFEDLLYFLRCYLVPLRLIGCIQIFSLLLYACCAQFFRLFRYLSRPSCCLRPISLGFFSKGAHLVFCSQPIGLGLSSHYPSNFRVSFPPPLLLTC